MKAEELRIGNITANGTVKTFYENGIHIGKGYTFPFIDVEPEPLTEQWLIKFGFEKHGQFWPDVYDIHIGEEEGDHCLSIDLKTGEMMIHYYCIHDSSGGKNKIQYVHQLQNLVHALTGNDLTLKD